MTTKLQTKGQRRLKVTPELIEEFFVHGGTIRSELPDDARLVNQWIDEQTWTWTFLFESVKWDALDEGETIPESDFQFEHLD